MELMTVIKNRRSIRSYKSDPVPRETLLTVLEAARLAPSWKNRQCWRYIVVSDASLKQGLSDAVRGNPSVEAYANAPYVLVLCADPAGSGNRDEKPYFMTDAAISFDHVTLAAQSLGLGTCWVGAFNEAPIKELLGIPEAVKVIALSPLGFPDEAPDARPRKPIADIAYENGWEQPLQ